MGSESIGHEAKGRMGYCHESKLNNNVLVLNPTSWSKKYPDRTLIFC